MSQFYLHFKTFYCSHCNFCFIRYIKILAFYFLFLFAVESFYSYFILLLHCQENSNFTPNAFPLFIFLVTCLFCYFVLKKTQFHHIKHFNSNSFDFYCISNHKNHNFTPIIFYFYFFFQNSKNSKNTNFQKFTQNAHFTLTSFLSPQFAHLESSSHITPHRYPTHHHSPQTILQKSHKKLIFYKKSKLPFLTPHLT